MPGPVSSSAPCCPSTPRRRTSPPSTPRPSAPPLSTHPGEVAARQAVVPFPPPPLPGFPRRLPAVIHAHLGPRLADHQGPGGAHHVQLDLAAARVARRPDPADGDRPHQP